MIGGSIWQARCAFAIAEGTGMVEEPRSGNGKEPNLETLSALSCINAASFWTPEYLPESAWLEHGSFAFWLMSAQRPRRLVELGTHNGFSYFTFCQAVQRLGLDTECHAIDTWQGDEHAGFYGEDVFRSVSTINAERYARFSHLRRCLFDEALDGFADGSIDLLHIDGRHTYEDVLHDFSNWRPKMSARGVVLFHDTQVRERGFGVFRLWAELEGTLPSFEFHHGHGLGVLAVGPEIPPALRPLFDAAPQAREAIRAAYAQLGGATAQRYQIGLQAGQLAAGHAEQLRLGGEVEAQAGQLAAGQAEQLRLTGQVEAQAVAMAEFRTRLDAQSAALVGAREALAAGKAQRDAMERERREAEQQRDEAEASRRDAEMRRTTLETEFASSRRKSEVLRAELTEQLRRAEALDETVAQLRRQEQAARDALEQMQQSTLWRGMAPLREGLSLIPQSMRQRLLGRSAVFSPVPPAQPGQLPAAAVAPPPAVIDPPQAATTAEPPVQPALPARDETHLPWPVRRLSGTGSDTMRRVCIFSFYDPQGIVDDYVVFLLRKLGEFAERIIFYSNGPLSRDAEVKLKGVVDDVVLRPNVGYDVMAYKEGLERIGFNRDGLYDEALMVNHTCYGPVFPFAELFGEMEARDCDFWGVSAHAEMTPNPLTGVGTLPYHLNANFIAVRAGMLGSRSFRQYWDGIGAMPSYPEAIMSHEARFTEYFTQLGYKGGCYLDKRAYGTHYPAMLNLDETLIDRNPLVKRRAFFHDPRFFEHYAADLPRALRILAEHSDYDPALIWRNVVRHAELRTLNTNAALTSVLPDVRLKQGGLPDYGNIAVCAHVYYTDMLEEILGLGDTIPVPYDFIATTETAAKKQIIEETARGRKNIRNVIVRVVEQNRGRDMSALFITCRDLFLGDRYDLVCRLHTKKSPQVAAGQGNLFKRHMFENLLHSEGYTTNVLDLFHDRPWIGVAVPPLVHISYPTFGHVWFGNRPKAETVAKLLKVNIAFDPDTPVGAFGTMFWFRPKALRKLFAHPWAWTDFNAEPHHVDGGLAHVLERMVCYVAQDAGYTTEQIINGPLAGWNYAVLEYKLQKLEAALPNADFSYRCRILEDWRAAGYPTVPFAATAASPVTEHPHQPSSVKRSFSDLVLATKKSIEFRSPSLFRALRPVYRAATLQNPRSNREV